MSWVFSAFVFVFAYKSIFWKDKCYCIAVLQFLHAFPYIWAEMLRSYKGIGLEWDGNLCVEWFYEHRFLGANNEIYHQFRK